MTRHCLLLAVHALLALPLAPAVSSGQSRDLTRSDDAAKALVDTIHWGRNDTRNYDIRDHVTPKTSVSLRITHFNFLRYTPEFTVATREIPNYALLEGLWTQILQVDPGFQAQLAGAGAGPDTFLGRLAEWRQTILTVRRNLATHTKAVPKTVALDDKEIGEIVADRDDLAADLVTLETNRARAEEKILQPADVIFELRTAATATTADAAAAAQKAYDDAKAANAPAATLANLKKRADDAAAAAAAVERTVVMSSPSPNAEAYYAQQLYDAALAEHRALVGKVETFITLADEVKNGRVKDFEAQKAGTIVTATIRVQSLTTDRETTDNAAKEKPTTVRYLVSSERPVVAHIGGAYTRIDDVSVEKVQRLGNDVFKEIDEANGGADLVVYLTYMLTPLPLTRGWGLTLGTGVTKPGERLYLGASAKLTDRLVLTGGRMTQELREGSSALVGSGDLFESVKNVRHWGWFGSVSFTPF